VDTSEAICEDVVVKVVVEVESEECEGTKVLMANGGKAELGDVWEEVIPLLGSL